MLILVVLHRDYSLKSTGKQIHNTSNPFGSKSNSFEISLAIGPTVTIAIVLFAVQISTKLVKTAIPYSAPPFAFKSS